jgi:hypothetical protein
LGNPGGDQLLQDAQYIVGYGANRFPIVAADFNGDGKIDLAIPDSESNTVFVLINTTGK